MRDDSAGIEREITISELLEKSHSYIADIEMGLNSLEAKINGPSPSAVEKPGNLITSVSLLDSSGILLRKLETTSRRINQINLKI